jgi:inner membrane protein
MDNLTHTLIGAIAGESVAQGTRARAPGLASDVRRGLFVVLAAVGGNLPDLDLLYSYRGVPHDTQAKLSYVLEHRGYTHTLLGCVLLALVLYAAAEWWLRRRRLVPTARDRLEIAGMSLFGTFLHLGMDFLNSYGVHPFWPVANAWHYGDSVFIVEPLYWAAAAPLVFAASSWITRVLVALALLGGVSLGILSHLVPTLPYLGFLALTLILLVVGSRAPARAAAITSAAAMVGVTATFVVSGQVAAHTVATLAATDFPGGRVIDHVLSPGPMNPLCWDVLLLETHGDRYVARHGVLANVPGLLPASKCRTLSGDRAATAPLKKVAVPETASVHWLGELEMSRAQLAQLVAGHCDAAALMQFVRAPFAAQVGRDWVIGDLRFEDGRGRGMADIPLGPPAHGPCPPAAPWVPPRTDLLQSGSDKR